MLVAGMGDDDKGDDELLLSGTGLGGYLMKLEEEKRKMELDNLKFDVRRYLQEVPYRGQLAVSGQDVGAIGECAILEESLKVSFDV